MERPQGPLDRRRPTHDTTRHRLTVAPAVREGLTGQISSARKRASMPAASVSLWRRGRRAPKTTSACRASSPSEARGGSASRTSCWTQGSRPAPARAASRGVGLAARHSGHPGHGPPQGCCSRRGETWPRRGRSRRSGEPAEAPQPRARRLAYESHSYVALAANSLSLRVSRRETADGAACTSRPQPLGLRGPPYPP